MYGKRGWTEPIKAKLAEYIEYETEGGNYCRFQVPVQAILNLLDGFPVAALTDSHNDSPSLTELVRYPEAHTLEGSIIGPGRADERLFIDGIHIKAACPPLDWVQSATEADELENGLFRLWWD